MILLSLLWFGNSALVGIHSMREPCKWTEKKQVLQMYKAVVKSDKKRNRHAARKKKIRSSKKVHN